MTTITRIRTDYDARLHVEEDTDATCDCFLVTLPPYVSEPGLLIYRKGADMNALWADALATVAHLKAQPWKLVAPPDHFRPFGIITARNREDVRREHAIRREMMFGGICQPEQIERMARINEADGQTLHERGVQHLIHAHDLLNDAPLPVAGPWPSLKSLN